MATKIYTDGTYRVFLMAFGVQVALEANGCPMATNTITPKPGAMAAYDPAYFNENSYYQDSVLTNLFRDGVEAFNKATGLNFKEV